MYQAIFIGIGCSIGNATAIFNSAESWLKNQEIAVIKKSSIHQTQPFGSVAKNIFSNAVWEITTKLSPQALFKRLKKCEVFHGRDLNAPHWSDRELDLDILMIGSTIKTFYTNKDRLHTKEQTIIIPHAGIPNRDFVLKPWKEIVPSDFIIPKFGSLKNLLEDLK